MLTTVALAAATAGCELSGSKSANQHTYYAALIVLGLRENIMILLITRISITFAHRTLARRSPRNASKDLLCNTRRSGIRYVPDCDIYCPLLRHFPPENYLKCRNCAFVVTGPTSFDRLYRFWSEFVYPRIRSHLASDDTQWNLSTPKYNTITIS